MAIGVVDRTEISGITRYIRDLTGALSHNIAFEIIPAPRGKSEVLSWAIKLITDLRRFDVVHANAFGPFCQIGKLMKVAGKMPLVITNHGLYTRETMEPTDWIWARRENLLLADAMRSATIVISVSRFARDLANRFGVRSDLIIPCGVNWCEFAELKRNDMPADKRVPQIVFVGSLTSTKSPLLLAEAVALLTIRHRLVFVGQGRLRSDLEKSVRKSRFSECSILPPLPTSRLIQLLAQSDVYVQCNARETFCIATLEAMASGLAVVVPNKGGQIDFVEDNRTGLIYESGSETDMARKIQQAIVDGREIGKRARECVSKHYRWEIIAPKIEEIYNRVASRG